MPDPFTWTQQRDSKLLAMRRKQLTFTECALVLGTTKDSAQGRAERLRKRDDKPWPKLMPPRAAQAPQRKELILTPANVRPDPGLSLWRPKTCQWIDGDPCAEDGCKCGKGVEPGAAWCQGHLERVYSRGKVL